MKVGFLTATVKPVYYGVEPEKADLGVKNSFVKTAFAGDVFFKSAQKNSLRAFQKSSPFLYPVKPLGRIFYPRFGQSVYDNWQYGAQVTDGKARFKLWAPAAEQVELVKIRPLTAEENQQTKQLLELQDLKKTIEYELEKAQKTNSQQTHNNQTLENQKQQLLKEISEIESKIPKLTQRIEKTIDMQTQDGDTFFIESNHKDNDFKEGMLYAYRLKYADGAVSKLLPDYYSRFQPEDVHGPSQIVDPKRFVWEDKNWKTPSDTRKLIPYRLHIGTFTQQGDFKSAMEQFFNEIIQGGQQYNAVEIMPVAEFSGRWNWGYDGIGYFATENSYGHPDQLREFVNECHKRGVAVILDVVYNHLGPEGNYFPQFDRSMVINGATNWGDGFNYDNPHAKELVMNNIKFLLEEFHIDGFRFDMTKGIGAWKDGPPRDDVTREITRTAYEAKRKLFPDNPDVIPTAEDARNLNSVTLPHDWHWDEHTGKRHDGLGMKAQWNFDFHHAVQGVITGYSHMGGPTNAAGLADVIERGFRWPAKNSNRMLEQMVNFTQSHDEIGNWDGTRIYPKVGPQKSRLALVLKYLIPGIPLNFAGEEYGAKTPFYYFVDHNDPVLTKNLEKSQIERNSSQPRWTLKKNFQDSKLSWEKDNGIWNLNKEIVRLRNILPALWQGGRNEMHINKAKIDSNILFIERRGKENPEDKVMIAINLSGVDYDNNVNAGFPAGVWQEILNTEDSIFSGNGLTNRGKLFSTGSQKISLPAHSVVIFRKISS